MGSNGTILDSGVEMNSAFEYRAYAIAAEDGRYTAKSLDGEPCDLRSRYLLRLLRAVDTLWSSLEAESLPSWFASWMNNPSTHIDLDSAADALALPEQCREDFADPISSCLKFPPKPLALVSRIAAASTAAALALMEFVSATSPIIELALA